MSLEDNINAACKLIKDVEHEEPTFYAFLGITNKGIPCVSTGVFGQKEGEGVQQALIAFGIMQLSAYIVHMSSANQKAIEEQQQAMKILQTIKPEDAVKILKQIAEGSKGEVNE